MVLAFIVRMRIDYRNHAIAAVIIIVAFVWKSRFDAIPFLIFFTAFIVFGSLKDYLGNMRQERDWLYKINEVAWYVVVLPLIFAIVTGDWLLFGVAAVDVISYDLVKYGFFYSGRYAKL